MDAGSFEFVTDTATMCVFDLQCLKHRLDDDADWWTTADAELEEVNQGNVAFVGLGDDGNYFVAVTDDIQDAQVEVNLRVPSGRVFIGAGEEVTSDGLEPECVRGGGFITLTPGNYRLLAKKEGSSLLIAFSAHGESANSFKTPIRF